METGFFRKRLKVSQLMLVDALAATGTLRQASARLNMAQPAASRILLELETALGVKLFERSVQGMTPTPFGESMIGHARRVLTDIDHAGADITALAQGEQGHVHIGAIVSASALLPRCVALIKTERPAVRIRIEVAGHNALLAGLRSHDLDLVIGRLLGQGDDDLDYTVLYNENFRVVARPGHPAAAAGSNQTLSELVDLPWILPPADGPMRHGLNALFAATAGRLPSNVVETVSMLVSLQILRDSDFLAVLPERVAEEYARHGMVAMLPLRLNELLGPVALITRAGPLRSRAVEAFRETVLKLGTMVP